MPTNAPVAPSVVSQNKNGSMAQYALVTANYWAFTVTDGALRMLVILHFAAQGLSPLNIALLFVFYELFGVFTNLLGGYLGARLGLNKIMNIGLLLQICALSALMLPNDMLSMVWVMAAQALSGVAKDLNKMSAKSAIKILISPEQHQQRLFRWVALLTGSKNALKGLGFFIGAILLNLTSFQTAVGIMAGALLLVGINSWLHLAKELGKSKAKPKFSQIFSVSAAINRLSIARLFLFAARDVWFVIALPVYLSSQLGWDHYQVGSFMALWIIAYGIIQTLAPYIRSKKAIGRENISTCRYTFFLALIPLTIAFALQSVVSIELTIIIGLFGFGAVFAINSSLHSYLIVHYATSDNVSLDIGFYYMSNAMGRLLGTLLSGYLFTQYGLVSCLLVSGALIFISAIITLRLPAKS